MDKILQNLQSFQFNQDKMICIRANSMLFASGGTLFTMLVYAFYQPDRNATKQINAAKIVQLDTLQGHLQQRTQGMKSFYSSSVDASTRGVLCRIINYIWKTTVQ